MEQKITELMKWIVEQALKNPYSEIGIKIVMHDGQIRKSEKILVEKQEGGNK